MKKEMEVWYAVSKNGNGCVFMEQPVRNDHFGVWEGSILTCINDVVRHLEADGLTLPQVKWGDEPVKMVISLSF